MATAFTRRLLTSLALAFLFLVGIMYAWPAIPNIIISIAGPIANTGASAIINFSNHASVSSLASSASLPAGATPSLSASSSDHLAETIVPTAAPTAAPMPGSMTQASTANVSSNVTVIPEATPTAKPAATTMALLSANTTVTPVPNSTVQSVSTSNGSIGGRINSPSGNSGTVKIKDDNGNTLGSASTQTLNSRDGFWSIDHLPLNEPLTVQATSGPYSTWTIINLTPQQPTAIISFLNWTGDPATPTPKATPMPTPAPTTSRVPDYGFTAKTWFDPEVQKHYISVTNAGNQPETFGIKPVENTYIPGGSQLKDDVGIPDLQPGQTSQPIEVILEPNGTGTVLITQIRGNRPWSQTFAVS